MTLSCMERSHVGTPGWQYYSLDHLIPCSRHKIETILDLSGQPIYQMSTTDFLQWLEKQKQIAQLSPAQIPHPQNCDIEKKIVLSHRF